MLQSSKEKCKQSCLSVVNANTHLTSGKSVNKTIFKRTNNKWKSMVQFCVLFATKSKVNLIRRFIFFVLAFFVCCRVSICNISIDFASLDCMVICVRANTPLSSASRNTICHSQLWTFPNRRLKRSMNWIHFWHALVCISSECKWHFWRAISNQIFNKIFDFIAFTRFVVSTSLNRDNDRTRRQLHWFCAGVFNWDRRATMECAFISSFVFAQMLRGKIVLQWKFLLEFDALFLNSMAFPSE